MSPIIISLLDDDYDLTDAAGGVRFDLDADGIREQTAWSAVGSDEAFLALDRNENGSIDDYLEVFGNYTPQRPSKEPNGWLALAVWDDTLNGGNEDGRIDAADAIFSELLLWRDQNHNGVSEGNELRTLVEMDVEYLRLDYGYSDREDEFGNQFKYFAEVGIAGQSRTAWDVFLVNERGGGKKLASCESPHTLGSLSK